MGGDSQLSLDHVDARHHLAYRVLHLQTRVHLQEEQGAVVCPTQELDGPGARVAEGTRCIHGQLSQVLGLVAIERGAGALLDQLLVFALDRALALAQVHGRAERIDQELHLHVPAAGEIALEVERAVTECRGRFGARA
jgi:hypothetical protein